MAHDAAQDTGWVRDWLRRRVREAETALASARDEAANLVMRVDLLTRQVEHGRMRLAEQPSLTLAQAEDYAVLVARAREAEAQLAVQEAVKREAEKALQDWQEAASLWEQTIAHAPEGGAVADGFNRQKRQRVGFSIIKAQEEERRRLARDIHDGPAQLLANVVFRIEVSQKLMHIDQARAEAELEQLKTLVRHSLRDVRGIIFDLRPMALDDLGLLPALRGYLTGYTDKTGLAADLVVHGNDRRLPSVLEVAMFRLVQEALNNAWKHAKANAVRVTLEFAPQAVKAVVEDDGQGFDLQEVMRQEAGEQFGLIGMRERAGLLDGTVEIDTAPGRGTRVSVLLPTREGGERRR